MKRRDFLKMSGIGGLSLGLSSCNDDDDNTTVDPTPPEPEVPPYNLEKYQPPKVYSQDGVLDYTLETKFAQLMVNGFPLHFRTYNGIFPSHSWMVKPGDTLKINLVNNLPAIDSEDINHGELDINIPHGFNNTNLHVHGLNVSPEGNQDNILLDIVPSEWTSEKVGDPSLEFITEFQYEIKIPADHPSGTFWYHPHKHGSSMPQLASGMAGFLVIEDGEGDLAKLPELQDAKTIDIVFSELIIDANGEVPGLTPGADNYRYPIQSLFKFTSMMQFTVNGLAVNEGEDPSSCSGAQPPYLKMRPGEVQRWRFALMCHLQTYKFVLEGHDIHVAAWDGLTDYETVTYNIDEPLVLGPGNRVDILVKASDTPGTYPFKMLVEQFGEFPLFITPGFCGGEVRQEMVAFNVIVEGEPANMALPAALNPPLQRLPDIRDEEITRRRTINFEIVGDVIFDWSTFQFLEDTRKFYISNLQFSAARICETIELGAVEEWEIVNIHGEHNSSLHINHPFHLHVNWFQVMEIHHPDGSGGFIVEKPNNGRGRWMDNIDVPFRGKAIVRIRFEKFPGITVFHCHVLAHEDEGMMYLVEMVDPTPVTSLISATSGGTLASQDASKRMTAEFPAGAFAADTPATYQFLLDMPYSSTDGSVGSLSTGDGTVGNLYGLERYFRLTSDSSLTGSATVTVNYPLDLSRGEVYDPATVRLYRGDGMGGWTTDGITHVSLGTAQAKIPLGQVVSTVSDFGDGNFAVLASLISGPVTEPVDGGSH